MRQTNVCLNRVYQVLCKSYVKYVRFASRMLTQTLVLAKKVCHEKQKKETKMKERQARYTSCHKEVSVDDCH